MKETGAASFDEDSTLFVYGSLLAEPHRQQILGRQISAIPATLRGYERKRRRHFFIPARAGSSTIGLMLLNLNARDFRTLDRYEELPTLYTREKVSVEDSAGELRRCWIYLPTRQLLQSV
jgi:gamma-glutamylcyclotransferase (GGCT)/AIG2-like uncharacterized protein YtfP